MHIKVLNEFLLTLELQYIVQTNLFESKSVFSPFQKGLGEEQWGEQSDTAKREEKEERCQKQD